MTARPVIPIVRIVGPSNSGKTTFLEKLLAHFTARGIRVATAKQHRHPVQTDVEGKDSWRHRRAGAVATFLVTPGELHATMDMDLEHDARRLTTLCPPGTELLILEGFKTHPGIPRIEVRRQGAKPGEPLRDEETLCVVSDMAHPEVTVPVVGFDEVERVAGFILALMEG